MRKSHGECDDKDENENDRIDFEYTEERKKNVEKSSNGNYMVFSFFCHVKYIYICIY